MKRNWNEDERRIKQTFSALIQGRVPLWLVAFSEGTRITPAKLAVSQAFAKSHDLPIPHHTLIPRTKGFIASVQGLRKHIAAVYDVTIAYDRAIPTFGNFAKASSPRFMFTSIASRSTKFPAAKAKRPSGCFNAFAPKMSSWPASNKLVF